MSEKKYEVLDKTGRIIAGYMDLETALLLIKAYCEEYYQMPILVTLKELDRTVSAMEMEHETD